MPLLEYVASGNFSRKKCEESYYLRLEVLMKRRLRRQIRLMQAYIAGSFLILLFFAVAAMTQSNATQRIDELNVQRLNVVDANGTLRLVISNKDRMHPGVIDGKTINRPRPEAGLLFFNDVGDEVGGLTYKGEQVNNQGRASASFTFDQWKQDQTIGIQYSDGGGQRSAGLQVWDRSDTQRLSEFIEKLNAANAIQDPAARDAAVRAARAGADPGYQRLFAGKDRERASLVMLADAAGKPRLTLKVQANGTATIEFLDAQGKVTTRLPK